MRLLQLSSPTCTGPPCPGVEHIYESPDSVRRTPPRPGDVCTSGPDSVRRTPPRPGDDWTSGPDSVRRTAPRPGQDCTSSNAVRNPAAVHVGGRYELPVNCHDQQTFTAVALTSAFANYSL